MHTLVTPVGYHPVTLVFIEMLVGSLYRTVLHDIPVLILVISLFCTICEYYYHYLAGKLPHSTELVIHPLEHEAQYA